MGKAARRPRPPRPSPLPRRTVVQPIKVKPTAELQELYNQWIDAKERVPDQLGITVNTSYLNPLSPSGATTITSFYDESSYAGSVVSITQGVETIGIAEGIGGAGDGTTGMSSPQGQDQRDGEKKRARRSGPLDEVKRKKAAFIRKLKACTECARRRVSCKHHELSLFRENYHRTKAQNAIQQLEQAIPTMPIPPPVAASVAANIPIISLPTQEAASYFIPDSGATINPNDIRGMSRFNTVTVPESQDDMDQDLEDILSGEPLLPPNRVPGAFISFHTNPFCVPAIAEAEYQFQTTDFSAHSPVLSMDAGSRIAEATSNVMLTGATAGPSVAPSTASMFGTRHVKIGRELLSQVWECCGDMVSQQSERHQHRLYVPEPSWGWSTASSKSAESTATAATTAVTAATTPSTTCALRCRSLPDLKTHYAACHAPFVDSDTAIWHQCLDCDSFDKVIDDQYPHYCPRGHSSVERWLCGYVVAPVDDIVASKGDLAPPSPLPPVSMPLSPGRPIMATNAGASLSVPGGLSFFDPQGGSYGATSRPSSSGFGFSPGNNSSNSNSNNQAPENFQYLGLSPR